MGEERPRLEFRGSPHAKSAPDVPKAVLEKELEFYALPKTLMPPAQELSPKLMDIYGLFNEMLEQIRASGMESNLPLEVFTFNEFRESKRHQRKWYIGPRGAWQARFLGKDDAFADFIEVTHNPASLDAHSKNTDHVFLKRGGTPTLSFSVLDIARYGAVSHSKTACLDALNQQAAKHGLQLMEKVKNIGEDIKLPFLYLTH